jgi:hypothetical protein
MSGCPLAGGASRTAPAIVVQLGGPAHPQAG